jgi:alanine-glyoxylate transaminase/serine-glyoxylate transaminase/serine-pyruvate transaminase
MVRKAVRGRSPKVLAVVHAETSTGVRQPLEDLGEIARQARALFLVDTVTSLGGIEVAVDRLGIDAVYSGTQKCLSCPPGLAPISFSPAALEALKKRKTPVVSWYLDMGLVGSYWGAERKYHHTAPINMIYALREALRIIAEEGLEARFARHRLNHLALVAGAETMGLEMLVPEAERLPMLNAIRIPEGADDKKVRLALLRDFGIEIGGGLGEFAGKVWRVGLMGHASCRKNVLLFLGALETILKGEGVAVRPGALEAAAAVYDEA